MLKATKWVLFGSGATLGQLLGRFFLVFFFASLPCILMVAQYGVVGVQELRETYCEYSGIPTGVKRGKKYKGICIADKTGDKRCFFLTSFSVDEEAEFNNSALVTVRVAELDNPYFASRKVISLEGDGKEILSRNYKQWVRNSKTRNRLSPIAAFLGMGSLTGLVLIIVLAARKQRE